MAQIPEHIIDQVRDATNIVDVVGRYVTLKKRGRNFIGLCPFHNEKTPSFSVHPEKQIFHCFGCGVGGNVFRFLMQYENLSFVDAVKRLAQEAGIALPVSPEFRKRESENERLYQANEIARKFYQHHLHHAPESVTSYLQTRGIKPEIMAQFQLGYAPEGWDNLLKYVEKGNYALGAFKKLGLFLSSEKGNRLYDRFRNRLMFPIHNPTGKVVGFGARQLDEDPKSPKYINSPESPVYQKSQVLYGLNMAKTAIREQGLALFVEGYMDVIQLFQSGIHHVVATSGTALTPDHARLIRRYANRVCLCYDADNAGIQAAVRGGEVLFQHHLEVSVLILPSGEDPDSFTRNHGPEAFLEALGGAQDYLDFRLEHLQQQYDMERAADRSNAVSEILDMLAPMQDAVRAGFYVEKISDRLNISRAILLNELRKKQSRRDRSPGQVSFDHIPSGGPAGPLPPESGPASPKKISPLILTGAWGAEKDIILILLNYYEDLSSYIFNHIQAEDFQNRDFRNIFAFIQSHSPPPGGASQLLHHVLDHIDSEDIRALLTRELFYSNREFQKPGLYIQGCIKQLKIAGYQTRIELARQKLKALPPADPEYFALLAEMQEAMNALKKWQDVVPSEEES